MIWREFYLEPGSLIITACKGNDQEIKYAMSSSHQVNAGVDRASHAVAREIRHRIGLITSELDGTTRMVAMPPYRHDQKQLLPPEAVAYINLDTDFIQLLPDCSPSEWWDDIQNLTVRQDDDYPHCKRLCGQMGVVWKRRHALPNVKVLKFVRSSPLLGQSLAVDELAFFQARHLLRDGDGLPASWKGVRCIMATEDVTQQTNEQPRWGHFVGSAVGVLDLQDFSPEELWSLKGDEVAGARRLFGHMNTIVQKP
ncbi:hypothetical protein CTRI78_v006732 [Colletotrichum trifolii]|uniref:Uncharacterized protein n=1 Tax=Colletotrichum trifolii TaxID=5466 RepID=A0A4V3HVX4_COLTR|nr:hypothetical protein CTRI78_v006732 [Colletotrichum trifolii]